MAAERGSWDGGDQGLLNDYFPNWNRLSFTYNVTPSAYYTYAPAYRRHGDDIKVVHFIGQEKPWHQVGHRSPQMPSSTSSSSSPSSTSVANNGKAQRDYASLLDSWFGVYEKYFGSTSTTTFTFPTLQAVWDAPSSSSGHSRAAYTPPSLEELKKQFQGVSQGQSIAMGGYKGNLSLSQQAGVRAMEGHYVSMPLTSGRPDLLGARVFVPKVEKPASPENAPIPDDETSPAIPPTHLVSPTPIKPEIALQAASPSHPITQEANRAWSPANVSWDPARSEPPKNDRPQMEAGFHYQAENVWDTPRSSSSQKTFFKPPHQYGGIPTITHQNYSQVTRSSPDQSKLKPVFPWESTTTSNNGTGSAPYYKPSRVFPPEQQREKMKLTPSRPAPPPPTSSSSGTGASNSPSGSRSHTPQGSSPYQYHYDGQHQHQHHHHETHDHHHRAHSGYDNQHQSGHHNASTASPVITDFANLSAAYGNAWDNVEGIRKYAKGLQGNGNRSSSSANGGKRQSPGIGGSSNNARSSTHHHGHQHHSSASQGTSSSGSSIAAHPHAPTISSSHSRSASIQAGNVRTGSSTTVTNAAPDHNRQRTTSSTGSGYDTGGEASSRDGDDEDEDEEDDPIDRRMAPIKFRNRSSPNSVPSNLPSTINPNGTRFQASSRSSSSETVTQHHNSHTITSSSHPGIAGGSSGYTNLPDTSSGGYKPNRVSRVFDPSTATDVIRKEGLEALHRFVRSMEAKGAAVNGKNAHDANGARAA